MQKVAALKAIDRQMGTKIPIIEMEDYDWAEKWVEERFQDFEVLVKDWVKAQHRKKTITAYTTPEMRIAWKLRKYSSGLTKTQLNNLTHLTKEQREKALANLIKDGTIEEKSTIGKGGRWRKIYRLKKDAEIKIKS